MLRLPLIAQHTIVLRMPKRLLRPEANGERHCNLQHPIGKSHWDEMLLYFPPNDQRDTARLLRATINFSCRLWWLVKWSYNACRRFPDRRHSISHHRRIVIDARILTRLCTPLIIRLLRANSTFAPVPSSKLFLFGRINALVQYLHSYMRHPCSTITKAMLLHCRSSGRRDVTA